jgi:hypothetical protein
MNTYNQNNQLGNNIMNFGPHQRELTPPLQEQLKQIIKSDASVGITAVLGDGEAYNFASQIKSYLDSEGYKVEGVDQAVYTKPISGQIIEPPKEGNNTYRIIIGENL